MGVLTGKRVLAVEDEPVVAMMLEDMLRELGCEVVGPAVRLIPAMEYAETAELDAAVLDVNIHAGRSYVVAEMLAARGVPFVYATGYAQSGVDARAPKAPVLAKPYEAEALERALAAVLAGAGDGRPR